MKLYYAPGACSLAPHIAATELGLPVEPIKVDLRSHKLADGTDYYTINPHGYVPLLVTDDGTKLTEVGVILQYLADRKPGVLAPAFGSMERYKLMELLNFIATEIHKTYGPLWHADTPQATRDTLIAKLDKRYDHVDGLLRKSPFLFGNSFGIADAYLYTVTNWAKMLKVDLSRHAAVMAYQARIAERPAVLAARAAESGAKVAA